MLAIHPSNISHVLAKAILLSAVNLVRMPRYLMQVLIDNSVVAGTCTLERLSRHNIMYVCCHPNVDMMCNNFYLLLLQSSYWTPHGLFASPRLPCNHARASTHLDSCRRAMPFSSPRAASRAFCSGFCGFVQCGCTGLSYPVCWHLASWCVKTCQTLPCTHHYYAEVVLPCTFHHSAWGPKWGEGHLHVKTMWVTDPMVIFLPFIDIPRARPALKQNAETPW